MRRFVFSTYVLPLIHSKGIRCACVFCRRSTQHLLFSKCVCKHVSLYDLRLWLFITFLRLQYIKGWNTEQKVKHTRYNTEMLMNFQNTRWNGNTKQMLRNFATHGIYIWKVWDYKSNRVLCKCLTAKRSTDSSISPGQFLNIAFPFLSI